MSPVEIRTIVMPQAGSMPTIRFTLGPPLALLGTNPATAKFIMPRECLSFGFPVTVRGWLSVRPILQPRLHADRRYFIPRSHEHAPSCQRGVRLSSG